MAIGPVLTKIAIEGAKLAGAAIAVEAATPIVKKMGAELGLTGPGGLIGPGGFVGGLVDKTSNLALELAGVRPGPGAPQLAGVGPTPLGSAPQQPAKLAGDVPIWLLKNLSCADLSEGIRNPSKRGWSELDVAMAKSVLAEQCPGVAAGHSAAAQNNPGMGVHQVAGAAQRTICQCQLTGPIIAGAAGETIAVKQCAACGTAALAAAEHSYALTLGWAQALERSLGEPGVLLGKGACGKMPQMTRGSVYDRWDGWDSKRYNHDLNTYQQCVAREGSELKAVKQKDKEAQRKAVSKEHTKEEKLRAKDKKTARHQLLAQKERFEQQIQAMKDEQAKATTAAEKAQFEEKIHALEQQKVAADQMAAQLQATAKDEQHQKQIDALAQQVNANAAKGPSAMDKMMEFKMQAEMMRSMNPAAPPPPPDPMSQMMNMMMMKQMLAPAPGPAPQAPPQVIMQQPPMLPGLPWAQQPAPMPMPVDQGPMMLQPIILSDDGGGGAMDYAGAVADPDVLAGLGLADPQFAGLSGADAIELTNRSAAGYSDHENVEYAKVLASMLAEAEENPDQIGGCNSGCAVPLPV